ncbi:hypothetical protein KP509_14G074100 [Ceratopteris richardii]|nr:hypothetical protein KP509_14G074100 [Ceratopteris richardii]
MQEEGIYPSVYTFIALLKACVSASCLEKGQNVHIDITKFGLEEDAYIGSSLVDMYAKCGSLSIAQYVFQKLSERNVSTWTAMISGYVQEGLYEHALKAFEQMKSEDFSPDAFTFVSLLKACRSLCSIDMIREIHNIIVKNDLEGNPYVSSTLTDSYASLGLLSEAKAILDEQHSVDVYSWTALISACLAHGSYSDVLGYFDQMCGLGVSPSTVTFTCILQACSSLNDVDAGQTMHIEIVKMGLEDDFAVANTLVDMYSTCDYHQEAEDVFNRHCDRDVVTWTALIAGYAKMGLTKRVFRCLEEMELEGISPNSVTYLACMKSCQITNMIDVVEALHAQVYIRGFEYDLSVGNALIDSYARCGAFTEAEDMLAKLASGRDIVSWNSLITGYVEHGYCTEALVHFEELLREGFLPTSITYGSSLKACWIAEALDIGQQIHMRIVKEGLECDPLVFNNLVSMYVKCDCYDEAWKLFLDLPSRDLIGWNIFIAGYGDSGQTDQALDCFSEMCMDNIIPDIVSWNSILSSLSEKGSVEKTFSIYAQMQEQGYLPDRIIFLSMSVACRNAPSLERGKRIHIQIQGAYGIKVTDVVLMNSLIEMYSNSGQMSDAQNLFTTMGTRNHISWSSLISGYACFGSIDHVLCLFQEAMQSGVNVDGVLILGVLSACAHAGLLCKGQEICQMMMNSYTFDPTIEHFASLIDLYSRAGQLNEALALINIMPIQPNVVIWFTILSACKNWDDVFSERMAFDHALQFEK